MEEVNAGFVLKTPDCFKVVGDKEAEKEHSKRSLSW